MNKKKFKESVLSALFMMILFCFYMRIFGKNNMIIGIFLGLAAIAFLRKDFNKEICYRTITFLIINIYLVLSAYVSTLNIYFGLIINIITIFIVTYAYMNDFKHPTSYIFLMAYAIMASNKINFNELPIRLLAVSTGVVIIIIVHILINKKKFKNKSKHLIENIIFDLKKQIEYLLKNKYDEVYSIKTNQKIRKVIIYVNEKSKKRFKNNKSELIELNVAICLYRLNIIISHLANYEENEKNEYLKDLKIQIDNISKFNKKLENIEDINSQIDLFTMKYKKSKLKFINESAYVFQIFKEVINETTDDKESVLSEIYENIDIPKPFNIIGAMKENFSFKSIRFRYAIRLAISISILIFVVGFTNIYHKSWIILSCYVVLQPYQEDGIIKAKQRFRGVIIGALTFFVVFNVVKGYLAVKITLFISFVGYFYFSEYTKKVVMTTILSLSTASLVENVQAISINRFLFVTIGICMGLLFNKYLLPYNIEDSIKELKNRYKKNTKLILKELEEVRKENFNVSNLIKLSMDRNKIEDNLILNSNKINQSNIEILIYKENMKMSDEKYLILKYLYKNYYECKLYKIKNYM